MFAYSICNPTTQHIENIRIFPDKVSVAAQYTDDVLNNVDMCTRYVTKVDESINLMDLSNYVPALQFRKQYLFGSAF